MDYSLFTTIMNSVNIGEGLLATILVGISVVIITRDTRAMKIILLPIAIGWARTGINVPLWVLFASGVISIVTVVGTQNLGRTLTTIAQAPQAISEKMNWSRQRNIATEAKKLNLQKEREFDINELTREMRGRLNLQTTNEFNWLNKKTTPKQEETELQKLISKEKARKRFEEWKNENNPRIYRQ